MSPENLSNPTENEVYTDFACEICGTTEAVEIPHVREYTDGQVIHICKNCGFIYVKKRRSYGKVAEVWSKELFGKTYTAKSPLMLARHIYIAEFIDSKLNLKDKFVCDIGAGEGQFLEIIREQYHAKVFGIEPSTINCELMDRKKIQNFIGTLEEYMQNSSSKKEHADIATFMWTLENATSCTDLLKGAYNILKKDGYLVVATGSRILVPFSKPLYHYLSTNPVDTHPSRFSIKTLTSILRKTGFKVLHTNPYLNDNLLLCIIAKKCDLEDNPIIEKDDYKKIIDFFERWHTETKHYPKTQNLTS